VCNIYFFRNWTIVGTEGTTKVLLPEYQVYKCFIILNNCAIQNSILGPFLMDFKSTLLMLFKTNPLHETTIISLWRSNDKRQKCRFGAEGLKNLYLME
jgi:hypothetical protein